MDFAHYAPSSIKTCTLSTSADRLHYSRHGHNGLFRHSLRRNIGVFSSKKTIRENARTVRWLGNPWACGKKPARYFRSLAGLCVFGCLVLIAKMSPLLVSLLFIPLFLFGIPLCSKAEEILGKSDPGEVIWDEFTAIPFVFLLIPQEINSQNELKSFGWLFAGFLVFRFFDILKPFGIKRLQSISGGMGVRIDDRWCPFCIDHSSLQQNFSFVFLISLLYCSVDERFGSKKKFGPATLEVSTKWCSRKTGNDCSNCISLFGRSMGNQGSIERQKYNGT